MELRSLRERLPSKAIEKGTWQTCRTHAEAWNCRAFRKDRLQSPSEKVPGRTTEPHAEAWKTNLGKSCLRGSLAKTPGGTAELTQKHGTAEFFKKVAFTVHRKNIPSRPAEPTRKHGTAGFLKKVAFKVNRKRHLAELRNSCRRMELPGF